MCRTPVEIDCRPPTTLMCSPALLGPVCRCEAPKPVNCEIRVMFTQDNPEAAIVAPPPGCDGLTAILAMSAAMAKLAATLR